MNKFFRFIGKKKGNRRSGSPWWGIFGEVVFASVLLLLGVSLLTMSVMLDSQAWAAKGLFVTWGMTLRWIIASLMVGFGSYRVARLMWTVGASAERRAAIISLGRKVELLNELYPHATPYEQIPPFDSLSNRAGKHFRYRVLAKDNAKIRFGFAAAFTVLMVGLSTVLVLHIAQSLWAPVWDVPGIVFALALAAVQLVATIWQVRRFVQKVLRSSGFGPTIVEIESAAIHLADEFQLFVGQSGRVRAKLIEVELQCHERTTFNQGTDIRTETKTVYQQRIFRDRGVGVSDDSPFETVVSATLPDRAMHSFRSRNNQVTWQIVVRCRASGWPLLERRFPIVVLPPVDSAAIVKRTEGDKAPDSPDCDDAAKPITSSTNSAINFLQLVGPADTCLPGEKIQCEYEVSDEQFDQIEAIETSVMWSTEGKGDRDIGVHFFVRRTRSHLLDDPSMIYRFETRLPSSPLSYDGDNLKIRWRVRLKVFYRPAKGATLGTVSMETVDLPFEMLPCGWVSRVQELDDSTDRAASGSPGARSRVG